MERAGGRGKRKPPCLGHLDRCSFSFLGPLSSLSSLIPQAKEGRSQVISPPGAWRGEGDLNEFFSLLARRPEARGLLATPGAFWDECLKLGHSHQEELNSSRQSYLFPGLLCCSVEGPGIHSCPEGRGEVQGLRKKPRGMGRGGGGLLSPQEGRAGFDATPAQRRSS